MSSMCDIIPEKCKGYDASIQIKSSPKEVAESSDIIISGTYRYLFLECPEILLIQKIDLDL